MKNELFKLKNDIVFQEVFGKQKNSEITKHLISLILERKIEDIELDVNKIMLGNYKDSKTGILDIRAKFNDGEDCNIELQVTPYKYMSKRMLIYWARMYQDKATRGKEYTILKPTISILIADYKLKELEDIEEYHTIWNLREKKHYKNILTKDIEMHILEIPKIGENEILKDELALWLKFIDNPQDEEVEKKMCENIYFKQAREELAELSKDPNFQHMVQSRAFFLMDQYSFNMQAKRDGLEEGKKEGKKEGRKEGRKEEKKEIAKKLLKLKMPVKQISEVTELAEEEIRKIKEEKN